MSKNSVLKGTLKDQILAILIDENKEKADIYASYCQRLLLEVDKKTGKAKNPFMATKSAEQLAQLFRRVKAEGLDFDGKHVTLQSTGISFDYVAYKNKMLIAYPESKIDMDVVKDGDTFTMSKDSGNIEYKHGITDPFKTADSKTIDGAYCIIKNKRGEFATMLSKEDIAKHRKVAKTDFIWSAWFKEMVLKTVIKKACKYHFDDVFEGMNEIDNEQIDLSRSLVPDLPVDPDGLNMVLDMIKSFQNLAELQEYYKGLAPEYIKNDDVLEAYTYQKSLCKPTK